MRVDPEITSAPVSITIPILAALSNSEFRLHTTAIVFAPFRLAYRTAAIVNGVRPLAAMPTTTSFFPGFIFAIARSPSFAESSFDSTAAARAFGPPGNYELHSLWICTKRRRTLDRIQRGDPTASPRPNVDQTATFSEGIGN